MCSQSSNEQLEIAKGLIRKFCDREYGPHFVDFSDLGNVMIADEMADFNDLENVIIADKMVKSRKYRVQVCANLKEFVINLVVDGVIVSSAQYPRLEDMIEYGLRYISIAEAEDITDVDTNDINRAATIKAGKGTPIVSRLQPDYKWAKM